MQKFTGFRFLNVRGDIQLTAVLVSAFFASGCGSPHTVPPTIGPAVQTLSRGIGGEPSSLDPASAADTFSFEVVRDLYEGLLSESPDGKVVPGVASSWTVDNTGTIYTFRLRDDALWSNGVPVRASDFIASWQRVLAPETGSPVADVLRPIRGAADIISGRLQPSALGVRATSNRDLEITLERPAPYFPQLLTHSATYPVYSEAAAKSRNSATWASNGAYVLESWLPGSGISLRANTRYWNQSTVKVRHVNYVIVADENSELLRYRAGELELTESVPNSALRLVQRERPTELMIYPYLATAYYALNLRADRFRDNIALRKALSMAIDRRVLTSKVLPFGQRPAYGFVPPGTWNYEPQSWDWQSLPDVERIRQAQRLYAEAGYSPAHPLQLRVLFNSNTSIKQVAIAIAAMWKQTLGIDCTLSDEEYRVFLTSRKDTSKWDVARLGWTADFNDASNFLDTLRRDSPNNDARYNRGDYDQLLDRAASTRDAQERASLLEKAESMMLFDYPVIPIYFFSSKHLVKPYVKGVQANPLNRIYSRHLEIIPH